MSRERRQMLLRMGCDARKAGRSFNSWPLGLGVLEVLVWYEGWCAGESTPCAEVT